jgi:hypothetical protein
MCVCVCVCVCVQKEKGGKDYKNKYFNFWNNLNIL